MVAESHQHERQQQKDDKALLDVRKLIAQFRKVRFLNVHSLKTIRSPFQLNSVPSNINYEDSCEQLSTQNETSYVFITNMTMRPEAVHTLPGLTLDNIDLRLLLGSLVRNASHAQEVPGDC